MLLCDMGARGWRILYANEPWSKATGALRGCRVCQLMRCLHHQS